jgi:hypothetical protein
VSSICAGFLNLSLGGFSVMLRRLAVLTALSLCPASIAHAATINGFFSAFGNDEFTNSTLTFIPGTSTDQAGIGGTFALYLTPGNPINFIAEPGGLPYTPGSLQTAPSGLPAFLTTSEAGETFSFFLLTYNASYVTPPASAVGCTSGDTCLLITGNGYFTGTGVVNYDPTLATFQFDTSYVPGQSVGSVTSFAAQASATGTPLTTPVPEPATLAMFGTGLLGVMGIGRRKLRAKMNS